jgi:hypothetical protein
MIEKEKSLQERVDRLYEEDEQFYSNDYNLAKGLYLRPKYHFKREKTKLRLDCFTVGGVKFF